VVVFLDNCAQMVVAIYATLLAGAHHCGSLPY